MSVEIIFVLVVSLYKEIFIRGIAKFLKWKKEEVLEMKYL